VGIAFVGLVLSCRNCRVKGPRVATGMTTAVASCCMHLAQQCRFRPGSEITKCTQTVIIEPNTASGRKMVPARHCVGRGSIVSGVHPVVVPTETVISLLSVVGINRGGGWGGGAGSLRILMLKGSIGRQTLHGLRWRTSCPFCMGRSVFSVLAPSKKAEVSQTRAQNRQPYQHALVGAFVGGWKTRSFKSHTTLAVERI